MNYSDELTTIIRVTVNPINNTITLNTVKFISKHKKENQHCTYQNKRHSCFSIIKQN